MLLQVAAFMAIALASRGIIAVSLATCGINAVAFRDLQVQHKHSRKVQCCRGCSLELAKHRDRFRVSRHHRNRFCELRLPSQSHSRFMVLSLSLLRVAASVQSLSRIAGNHRNRFRDSWQSSRSLLRVAVFITTAFASRGIRAIAVADRRVSSISLSRIARYHRSCYQQRSRSSRSLARLADSSQSLTATCEIIAIAFRGSRHPRDRSRESPGHRCCTRQLSRSSRSLARIAANKDGNSHGSDGKEVTALGYDHSDLRSK